MKMTRKIITMIVVLAMVLSMGVAAFADETATTKITFTGGATGSQYSAYQLLAATHGTDSDGNDVYAYSVNAKYQTALATVTGKTDSAEIIAYIEGLKTAADVRAFANSVWAQIKDLDADYTTTTDTMEVAQGYYLIAETQLGTWESGATDTYSLVMLDTVGDGELTIVTKESVPTLEKTVQEINDSTGTSSWGEHADYDIGDTIAFEIQTTVSGRYEEYINYFYKISDTMSKGLTLNKDVKIVIGQHDVTAQFTIVYSEDGHSFTATANLKEVEAAIEGLEINHRSEIHTTYTAVLNEDAEIGPIGNTNEAVLEYQNDPYAESDPTEPGRTPKDTTVVFTYESIVNKVDQNGNPLTGAGFTLYKWDDNANDWVAVKEINDLSTTTFSFAGLDAGEYKLVETKVPEGYNKAEDIEFEIVAIYDTTKDPVEVTDLKVVDRDGDPMDTFTIVFGEGAVETTVVNKAGAELPETGGMGTTLFYVMGTIMFLGAAVVLVTKKRMAA